GLGGVAKILKYLVVWFCGIEINYKTRIGRNFQLHHGYGTIVSGTLGDNVHVNQGVTIGGNWGRAVGERSLPVIGNNVWIMAGAKVLGPITIGNNVLIGANAVVLSDVPDNSVVAGVPGRVLRPISGADLEMLTRMER
ncbi:MAG: hypothetical protein L0H83_05750, partial [Salinisphaera sp.]|nr:hypothetical protein [Salinisphaera sp.]